MGQRFYHVDAFTKEPFRGNPAVVVPMEGPGDARWMQCVAAEMNVSETAFFHPIEGGFALRWFTPTMEVDLCGHATLASAYVLRELGEAAIGATVRFETASGWLPVEISAGLLRMDFPAEVAATIEAPPQLAEGLGCNPTWVGRNKRDIVVELESASEVRSLSPDLRVLAELPGRGVIVTARGDQPGIDYVCRVFGPKAGIPEDPVTGSAQCALGPHWAAKLGKQELRGYQASRRGGDVFVSVGHETRVDISGYAVMTSAGELRA